MSSFAEECAYCTLNARECVLVATVIFLRQHTDRRLVWCRILRRWNIFIVHLVDVNFRKTEWKWSADHEQWMECVAVRRVRSSFNQPNQRDDIWSATECVTVRKRVYEWRVLAQLCINYYNFIFGRKSVRACECVQCSAHGKCWRCFFSPFPRISQLKWKICPKFPRHGVARRVSSSLFFFSFRFFARKTFA